MAFVSDAPPPASLVKLLVLSVPGTLRGQRGVEPVHTLLCRAGALRGISGAVAMAVGDGRAAAHSGANFSEINMETRNPLDVRGSPGRCTISRLEKAKDTNTHQPVRE